MAARTAARPAWAVIAFTALVVAPLAAAAQAYFPDATWQHKEPAEVGLKRDLLQQAVDFAIANEAKAPRDLVMNHYQSFGREPFGYAVGPIKERGAPTGLIIRHGYIVAEWGEPLRVDMTHSVSKSFLSTVIGVAFDRGLIRSIDDAVKDYVPPIEPYDLSPPRDKSDRLGKPDLIALFDTPHNRTITWDHMLRQTSDWEGTLWGKPDWADRPKGNAADWTTRPRRKSGTFYEYNDVRVNALALAALNVWRRPLPQVLKETIMDPIGASNTWRWFGYENSWIVLDGIAAQSVSGGGHWGGGMFINAYDMGRFGYLTLRHGNWKDRQLISDRWVDWALTPTAAEPTYGFMNWFLNTDRKLLPSAPANVFVHIGNGANMIIVDPDRDLVSVVRWIDSGAADGFVKRVITAAD
jgi:CubicO group peptidase (beta-lactamase class C family)